MRAFEFLYTIEPFVQEDSFLNDEARKLKSRMGDVSDSLSLKNISKGRLRILTAEYDDGKEVYKSYSFFHNKLLGDYLDVKKILVSTADFDKPGQDVIRPYRKIKNKWKSK